MVEQPRAPVLIRPESVGDHGLIRFLTACAFAGHAFSDGTEPRIIDAVRQAQALVRVAFRQAGSAGPI